MKFHFAKAKKCPCAEDIDSFIEMLVDPGMQTFMNEKYHAYKMAFKAVARCLALGVNFKVNLPTALSYMYNR